MESTTILERSAPVRTVTYVRPAPRAAIAPPTTLCSNCALRSTCLPRGLQQREANHFDELVSSRRRIRRGEHVYHAGDPFKALYAFRLGSFKSYVDTADGQTQATGFPMAGDVVGMDGIEGERHRMNVIALEDGEVCVIPYTHFLAVALRVPVLQQQMHKMMSREIVRGQELLALLGGMRAEPRVAAFLLTLSEKFAARGYSAIQFHLRMSRDEIGSYLGLKLETVSRVLSRFHDRGLIKAKLRDISLADLPGLKAVASDS